jgi:outer membrane lipoprotein-sorting protein
MNRKAFALAVSSAVLLCPGLRAENNNNEDPKAILAKASQAYDALQSYQFEGKSVSETTIGGKATRSEVNFVVAYQSPNKLRLEFRYPTAGNWVRVSDGESMLVMRTLTKESRRAPADDRTVQTLKSSPVYMLQNLAETAENPHLLPSESIDIGGHPIDCYVIRFATHPLALSPGESAGTSTVWVDKKSGLVLRQEIRTSASGTEPTEGKRTVIVENFNLNGTLASDVFSTDPHHRERASAKR